MRTNLTSTEPRLPVRARGRGRPGRLAVAAGLTVGMALGATAGCSGGGDTGTAASITTGRPSTTEAHSRTTQNTDTSVAKVTGCPDADAVAEVVGGPVDQREASGLTYEGSPADAAPYSFEGCRYIVIGSAGKITISLATNDAEPDRGPYGTELFDLMATAAHDDFTHNGFEPLDGVAHAYRDRNEVGIRTPSTVLVVGVVASDGSSDIAASTDLAIAMAERDQPIGASVPCAGLTEAVGSALGDRAENRGPGIAISTTGTSIGTVPLNWSGCSYGLADGRTARVGVVSPSEWDVWVAAKLADPETPVYEELTVGGHTAFDDGQVLVVDTGDDPLVIETDGDDLGPDQATLRVDLAELALGA